MQIVLSLHEMQMELWEWATQDSGISQGWRWGCVRTADRFDCTVWWWKLRAGWCCRWRSSVGRTSPAGPSLCSERAPRDLMEEKNHTTLFWDVNNIKEMLKQRPNRASSYILHNYHHFFMFSYQYWALCLKSDSHTCCWQAGKLLFPGRPVAWWQCGPALCCSCPATIPAPRVAAGCPPFAPPPDTGTRQSIHYCRYWEHLTTRCEKSWAARRERRTNKSSD